MTHLQEDHFTNYFKPGLVVQLRSQEFSIKMRQSLEEHSEFPTRLKSFLETNELNIADLFQLSLAELEKVPNFGPDTLNFISSFMRKNGNQFSETTKIHEIVKNPYEALLSTKSKRLVDELSNDEVQQIRTLGPEGIVKLPRLSSVGEKTSRKSTTTSVQLFFNKILTQKLIWSRRNPAIF